MRFTHRHAAVRPGALVLSVALLGACSADATVSPDQPLLARGTRGNAPRLHPVKRA